jgi:hypothetical protein
MAALGVWPVRQYLVSPSFAAHTHELKSHYDADSHSEVGPKIALLTGFQVRHAAPYSDPSLEMPASYVQLGWGTHWAELIPLPYINLIYDLRNSASGNHTFAIRTMDTWAYVHGCRSKCI